MADGIETEIAEWPFQAIDVGTVLSILYIIVGAYIIVRVAGYLLRKLAERAGQYRIMVTMVIPLFKLTVYLVALSLILSMTLEPSLSQLVAFSGLFGAALGFGLKDIFADVIGGIVITFERPYQIGDKIAVGDDYGEVVDIGLRSTRIVTPDDSTISIPNFVIFNQSTASANAGKTEMMVVIDLFIDTKSDAGLALGILRDAVVTSKYVYITPSRPYTILIQDFPFYRRIRAKAYVNDLRSEFEFKSEVTRRAWMEFARQEILPPRAPVIEQGAVEP
jgi:small-conductance mechanosensitive channel